MRRARAGDQDAFAELVMMHADRVYAALRRFGLDAGEADEVAQEVFVRAWRGLGRFEERSRFSTSRIQPCARRIRINSATSKSSVTVMPPSSVVM